MGWQENEGIDEWELDKLDEPTGVEMVFPANAMKWLPSIKCIGTIEEAHAMMRTNWGKYVSELFFRGGRFPSKPRDGINPEQVSKILKIVKACLGTFACSHEQKIGGIAWILDKHFEWTDEEQNQIDQ